MKKIIVTYTILFLFHILSSAQPAWRSDTLASLPWDVVKSYAKTTGKQVSIGRDDLERQASGDLRNRLTGMLPGLEVTEYGGGIYRAASSSFTNYNIGGSSNEFNLNGLLNVRLFLDDMPIPFNQLLLDPNQIESVTVLSDVLDKAKMGPMASYGAVLLKTRRGDYNTPLRISVSAATDVNFVGDVPEWASGADYAALNNQIRTSAGLTPLYSKEAIDAFANHNEIDRQYPAVNYKDLMLREVISSTTFGIDASAGSKRIKYHLALNGLNSGDIFWARKTDYNKINITGNIAAKIGNYVEASAGFMGLLSFRRTPNINWYDFRSVPEVAYPLVLGRISNGNAVDQDVSTMTGSLIYGVSKTFPNNYYATLMEGGRQTVRNRSGIFWAGVDLDMSWLLKGLKSKTKVLTSSFLSTTIGKSDDYIAYYWDMTEGIQELSSHKGKKQTSRSQSQNTTSAILSLYERLYYDWSKKGHSVDAGMTYYMSSSAQTGDSYYQRLQFFEGDVSWSYKGRYNVELSAQYAGSSRFKKGARWGFFPSAGVSWIATNEDFLKGNKVLTNLKLYAQTGDIGQADLFGAPYLYQAVYSNSAGIEYGPSFNAGLQWFGNNNMSSTITTLSRLANQNLTWTRLSQQNVGIDIGLLDCIYLSADWFMWRRYGNIADVLGNTPEVFGINATMYYNYESVVTSGFNVTVGYRNRWGDFSLNAWAWASLNDQINETLVSDNYIYEYQKLSGKSTYDIRGFECLGKYESMEEIQTLPSYVDKSSLKVGDLKYKDQNDDGVIDVNDQVVIGTTNPKLRYTLNVSMGWKNFDLLLVGTGRIGGDLNMLGNSYFNPATGMGNQSQFVIDELGKTLPRVDYYGVPNNEVTSSWWLRDRSWFKLQVIDIGYNIPMKKGERLGIQSIRVDIKGSNLLTFTKLQYVDPEDASAGVTNYPFFRTLTVGAKIVF